MRISDYDITLDELLDIIGDFEFDWYEEHTTVWTDAHIEEYRRAKTDYIEERARDLERAKAYDAETRRFFCDDMSAETAYGWYQQDIIDSYRRER